MVTPAFEQPVLPEPKPDELASARQETKIRRCKEWLEVELLSGDRPASEMEALAGAQGFAGATLYKARRRAGVRSERQGNQWIWSLAAYRKQTARS